MTLVIVIAVVALVLVAGGVLLYLRLRRPPASASPAGESTLGEAAERVADRAAVQPAEQAAERGVEQPAEQAADRDVEPAAESESEGEPRPSMRDRLGKARAALAGSLASVLDRSSVSEEAWTEVTEALIRADVGLAASTEIVDAARARAVPAEGPAGALDALQAELRDRLGGYDRSLARRSDDGPSIWLFVGVNGTGKTTTIGKLARREADAGAGVVLAAGDTFRAAAADQLSMWAERSSAQIVRGAPGADPASVVYDAVEAAAARGADLVLADTAGRLHTERNLMAELAKVRRVADKGSGTVTETLLVLDATTGQNGLAQARQFTEAVGVTGVVLTKLDGSARGGIVVAVQAELGVPVKLVGLGEGIRDLVDFDESDFVEALFA